MGDILLKYKHQRAIWHACVQSAVYECICVQSAVYECIFVRVCVHV